MAAADINPATGGPIGWEPRSYWQIVARQFRKNRLAVWGLRVVVGLILVAIFAPLLANDKPLIFHGYRYKLYSDTWKEFAYLHGDLAGLGDEHDVYAPADGTVGAVYTPKEEKVEQGGMVLVLETKSEDLRITTPKGGTIEYVAKRGDKVRKGDLLARVATPLVIPNHEDAVEEGIYRPSLIVAYQDEQRRWEANNPTWKMIQDSAFGDANQPMNDTRAALEDQLENLEKDPLWARGAMDVEALKERKLTSDLEQQLDDLVAMCRENMEESYRAKTRVRLEAIFQKLDMLKAEVGPRDRQAVDELASQYRKKVDVNTFHTKKREELKELDTLLLDGLERLHPQKVSFESNTSFPALRQLHFFDLFFMPAVLLWFSRGLWGWLLGMFSLPTITRIKRQVGVSILLPLAASISWALWVPEFNDVTDYKRGMDNGDLWCEWRLLAPINYGVNENDTKAKNSPPWWWSTDTPAKAPARTLTKETRKEIVGPTWAVAWSPDGTRLASATSDGVVHLWKGRLIIAELPGLDVAWSPDGRVLATADGRHIRLYDGRTGAQMGELTGHTATILCLAWSPDSDRLASGSRDGDLRIWTPREGEHSTALTGHTDAVQDLAWSIDGLLATASWDGTVRVWNAAGSPLATLRGHQGEVDVVDWSPYGDVLASGARDRTIRVWSSKGERLAVMTGHTGPVKTLDWSPNRPLLASGSWDGTTRVWSRHGGEAIQTLEHESEVEAVAWSGNGSNLASAGRDETIRMYMWDQRELRYVEKAFLTAGGTSSQLNRQFDERLDRLKRTDLEGNLDLALWCKANRLDRLDDVLPRIEKQLGREEEEGNPEVATWKRSLELVDAEDSQEKLALARWARERNLRVQALSWIREVHEAEPDNVEARRALGHQKVDGEWLEGDELSSRVGHRLVDLAWSGGEGKQLASTSWDGCVQVWKGEGGRSAEPVVVMGEPELSRSLTRIKHSTEELERIPRDRDAWGRFLEFLALHHMGTDDTGRDLLTRMIWGSRISLSIGFVAVGIYVFIGIVLGALAGYFGGWMDMGISRVIEIVICFPAFFLILTVIAFVGPSVFNIMVVIGITRWTGVARLVRGEFLRLRNLDFVTAGKALGFSNMRVIFRHVLPNALAPVLVSATFGVAAAILIESSLSFLGFGVTIPTPTWGSILSSARQSLEYWWIIFFPGAAIFLTVTMYNLVGEGIRDAVDPKMRKA